MDNPIMLTPQQIINMFLATCAALVTVSTAATIIVKLMTRAKEPEERQNARLDLIERRLDEMDRKLSIDKKRLDNIEYGHEVTQEALLALLDHALNNNETEGLKLAKKKLEGYLISARKEESYESHEKA